MRQSSMSRHDADVKASCVEADWAVMFARGTVPFVGAAKTRVIASWVKKAEDKRESMSAGTCKGGR